MSEYIFVTNIFEYLNIWIYSSHSGAEIRPLVPAEVKEENTEEVNGGLLVTSVQSQYVLQLTSIMYGLQWRVFGVAD